ncbi:MAG: NERD domain-containing protein [Fibrobacterales bacterium]
MKKSQSKQTIVLVVLLALAFILTLVLKGAFGWDDQTMSILNYGLIAFAIIVAAKIIRPQDKKQRKKAAYVPPATESDVKDEFTKLPEEFTVYRNLLLEGEKIEYTIVGPNGLFVAEIKDHNGSVSNDGNRLKLNNDKPPFDFTKDIWTHLYTLKEHLEGVLENSPYIRPILCFSAAYVKVRRPVKGLGIVNYKYIASHIQRQKGALSDAEMADIKAALDKLKTA